MASEPVNLPVLFPFSFQTMIDLSNNFISLRGRTMGYRPTLPPYFHWFATRTMQTANLLGQWWYTAGRILLCYWTILANAIIYTHEHMNWFLKGVLVLIHCPQNL